MKVAAFVQGGVGRYRRGWGREARKIQMDRWHTHHAWAKVTGWGRGGEGGAGFYSGNGKRKPLKLKCCRYSGKKIKINKTENQIGVRSGKDLEISCIL